MSRRLTAVVVVASAMITALLSSTPAYAAVPRIVLVYGPLLAQPVIMTDWAANGWVVSGDERDPTTEGPVLTGRPYLEVALFWGGQWDDYIVAGKPVAVLRPEQANQHARFYPAVGDAPAIVEGVGYPLRLVSPDGLAELQRRGVVVRVDLSVRGRPSALPQDGDSPNADALALIGLGAGLVVVGGMIRTAAVGRRAIMGRECDHEQAGD